MGKSSQRKGRDGEREIVSILHDAGFTSARVGMAVSFGEEPDVVCSELPIHWEVKRCERLQLPAWVEQAERDEVRFRDGFPVVVFRQSRQPWRVCLRLSDFLRLLKYLPVMGCGIEKRSGG